MKTLLDLAIRMERAAERIPEIANEAKQEVAVAIQTDLARVTPVDTSKAVSNWVMSRDEPFAVELEPYYEGEQGSTFDQSSQAVIAQGLKVAKTAVPGESLFISNNADYIRDLNDGSSDQAPVGFVQRSVIIGRKVLKNFKVEL